MNVCEPPSSFLNIAKIWSVSFVAVAGLITITTVAVPEGEYRIFKSSIADDQGAVFALFPDDVGAVSTSPVVVTLETIPLPSLVNCE